MAKKSYNPFKMWGSYVGAVVGAVVGLISKSYSICVQGLNLNNAFCSISQTIKEFGLLNGIISIPKLLILNIFKLSGMSEIMVLPILLIFGFLIGWGIHSLIRAMRK